ncbi:ATP-grasp domain-containing protein, partial [Pseudomonas aeruginosa]
PAVLKTRTLGYDGKGQKVLRQPADVQGAFAELGSVPCILEGFVPFTGEVSLVAVRARDGETRFYPLVHNTHDSGILKLSVASSGHPLQALAEDYVGRVLARLDYVGVLAFEFFEVDGGLKANEIAPRVHNSGHWTIEGAECSQFENHLRAVAGLPLGSTAKVGESAMLNFIGAVPPVAQVVAVADCHLHHYGKAFKNGRKVGHATLRCVDRATLQARIAEVEALIEA